MFMNNLKATAWREEAETMFYYYKVQITNITSSENKNIKEIFKEWDNVADGWRNDQTLVSIYKKKFKSPAEWETWASKQPFQLEEIKYRKGLEKRILLSKGK